MRILILYEELAWYIINCLNDTARLHDTQILVFCKKPNAVAPFQFPFVHPNITIVERETLSEDQLVQRAADFSPDGVFLGGWSTKSYIKIVRMLNVRTIIAFDNQWNGSLRQRTGSFYFRIFLKRHMHHAFVPGNAQAEFARRLGFTGDSITTGMYCCDFRQYNSYYNKYKAKKHVSFPRRFLFVGRYSHEKGIDVLWNAFAEWQKENPNGWELWCVGKGPLKPAAHSKIRHFGFVQAHQMDEIIANTGVFVLPSTFEPWGVVVHEFAAAGYPLMCTSQTGATELFLDESKNGFLIENCSKEELKEKMNKFSSCSQMQWNKMSDQSIALASTLTPEIWAERFVKLFEV